MPLERALLQTSQSLQNPSRRVQARALQTQTNRTQGPEPARVQRPNPRTRLVRERERGRQS